MNSAPRSSRIVSPEDVPAQRLLFEIARSLVENVDAVSVDVLDDNGSRTLVVWADADGYGRLEERDCGQYEGISCCRVVEHPARLGAEDEASETGPGAAHESSLQLRRETRCS